MSFLPDAAIVRSNTRSAFRRNPSGVLILTTTTDGVPYGLAVNSFASVALEPVPTVLACINASSRSYPHISRNDLMGLSFLSQGQDDVVRTFGTSGGDKFADIEWFFGEKGVPLIANATAHLECRIVARHTVGSHIIVLGEVLRAECAEATALLYVDGECAAIR